MHTDPATRVPAGDQLPEGTFVRGEVVCHHPFGIGIRVDEVGQYGHVDVPHVRDSVTRGSEDYPRIGVAVSAVVLGHDGHGQLRLTTRLRDLPGVGESLTVRPDDGDVRPSGGDAPMDVPHHRGETPADQGSGARYLLTLCIVLGLYLLAEWLVPSFRSRPLPLVTTMLIAPVIGALAAELQARSGRGRAKTFDWYTGFGLTGLAGASLVLGQVLTANSAQWVLVGLCGLMAGAAGHAWWRDRQRAT